MNIGLALLYAAFAVVALWLLGEVLLQHRAPAQWRALALLGFLGLVAGVHQGSAPIVGGGVLAFGAGQGLVTRSVKRGGGPHWSLRRADGALPGPLGALPLLGRVFPAAEVPEAAAETDPARRVGTVGPIEESAEPALAQPESVVEFVESRPYDGEPDESDAPGGVGAYGAQPPQQTAQPYPQPYPQGYEQGYQPGYQQEYGYPYQQPVPQAAAAGYEGWQYQQEYAQEYARYQQSQPPQQSQYQQPGGYYGEPGPAGYGYDPAAAQPMAQPQPPGYGQQPSSDDYDAVGYNPQGTYQYDYQAPGQAQAQYQQQPEQPQQQPYGGSEPEPWTYG